jgi:flagellar biosynthesis protein FliR
MRCARTFLHGFHIGVPTIFHVLAGDVTLIMRVKPQAPVFDNTL